MNLFSLLIMVAAQVATPNGPQVFSLSGTGSSAADACLEAGNADCTMVGSVWGNAGTAALPAFSGNAANSNTDEGMYFPNSASLGFSVLGTLRLQLSTSNILGFLPYSGPDGTAALPAYTFNSQNNTGFYRSAANVVALSTAGVLRWSVSSTGVTSTLPLTQPAGTAAAPSINFTGDTTTGLYDAAVGSLGFATAGVNRATLLASGFAVNVPMVEAVGSAAAPSYTFTGDTNNGIFQNGADVLGFTTNGVLRTSISTTAVNNTLPILSADGSNTAPSYSFTNYTGRGMFATANNVNIVNGTIGTAQSVELNNSSNTVGLRSGSFILSYNNAGALVNSSTGSILAGAYLTANRMNASLAGTAVLATAASTLSTDPAVSITGIAAANTVTGIGLQEYRSTCSGNDCTTGSNVMGGVYTQAAAGVEYRGSKVTTAVVNFADTTYNPYRSTAPAALPTCTTNTVGLYYKEDTDAAATPPAFCLCSKDNTTLTYSYKLLSGTGTCN